MAFGNGMPPILGSDDWQFIKESIEKGEAKTRNIANGQHTHAASLNGHSAGSSSSSEERANDGRKAHQAAPVQASQPSSSNGISEVPGQPIREKAFPSNVSRSEEQATQQEATEDIPRLPNGSVAARDRSPSVSYVSDTEDLRQEQDRDSLHIELDHGQQAMPTSTNLPEAVSATVLKGATSQEVESQEAPSSPVKWGLVNQDEQLEAKVEEEIDELEEEESEVSSEEGSEATESEASDVESQQVANRLIASPRKTSILNESSNDGQPSMTAPTPLAVSDAAAAPFSPTTTYADIPQLDAVMSAALGIPLDRLRISNNPMRRPPYDTVATAITPSPFAPGTSLTYHSCTCPTATCGAGVMAGRDAEKSWTLLEYSLRHGRDCEYSEFMRAKEADKAIAKNPNDSTYLEPSVPGHPQEVTEAGEKVAMNQPRQQVSNGAETVSGKASSGRKSKARFSGALLQHFTSQIPPQMAEKYSIRKRAVIFCKHCLAALRDSWNVRGSYPVEQAMLEKVVTNDIWSEEAIAALAKHGAWRNQAFSTAAGTRARHVYEKCPVRTAYTQEDLDLAKEMAEDASEKWKAKSARMRLKDQAARQAKQASQPQADVRNGQMEGAVPCQDLSLLPNGQAAHQPPHQSTTEHSSTAKSLPSCPSRAVNNHGDFRTVVAIALGQDAARLHVDGNKVRCPNWDVINSDVPPFALYPQGPQNEPVYSFGLPRHGCPAYVEVVITGIERDQCRTTGKHELQHFATCQSVIGKDRHQLLHWSVPEQKAAASAAYHANKGKASLPNGSAAAGRAISKAATLQNNAPHQASGSSPRNYALETNGTAQSSKQTNGSASSTARQANGHHTSSKANIERPPRIGVGQIYANNKAFEKAAAAYLGQSHDDVIRDMDSRKDKYAIRCCYWNTAITSETSQRQEEDSPTCKAAVEAVWKQFLREKSWKVTRCYANHSEICKEISKRMEGLIMPGDEEIDLDLQHALEVSTRDTLPNGNSSRITSAHPETFTRAPRSDIEPLNIASSSSSPAASPKEAAEEPVTAGSAQRIATGRKSTPQPRQPRPSNTTKDVSRPVRDNPDLRFVAMNGGRYESTHELHQMAMRELGRTVEQLLVRNDFNALAEVVTFRCQKPHGIDASSASNGWCEARIVANEVRGGSSWVVKDFNLQHSPQCQAANLAAKLAVPAHSTHQGNSGPASSIDRATSTIGASQKEDNTASPAVPRNVRTGQTFPIGASLLEVVKRLSLDGRPASRVVWNEEVKGVVCQFWRKEGNEEARHAVTCPFRVLAKSSPQGQLEITKVHLHHSEGCDLESVQIESQKEKDQMQDDDAQIQSVEAEAAAGQDIGGVEARSTGGDPSKPAEQPQATSVRPAHQKFPHLSEPLHGQDRNSPSTSVEQQERVADTAIATAPLSGLFAGVSGGLSRNAAPPKPPSMLSRPPPSKPEFAVPKPPSSITRRPNGVALPFPRQAAPYVSRMRSVSTVPSVAASSRAGSSRLGSDTSSVSPRKYREPRPKRDPERPKKKQVYNSPADFEEAVKSWSKFTHSVARIVSQKAALKGTYLFVCARPGCRFTYSATHLRDDEDGSELQGVRVMSGKSRHSDDCQADPVTPARAPSVLKKRKAQSISSGSDPRDSVMDTDFAPAPSSQRAPERIVKKRRLLDKGKGKERVEDEVPIKPESMEPEIPPPGIHSLNNTIHPDQQVPRPNETHMSPEARTSAQMSPRAASPETQSANPPEAPRAPVEPVQNAPAAAPRANIQKPPRSPHTGAELNSKEAFNAAVLAYSQAICPGSKLSFSQSDAMRVRAACLRPDCAFSYNGVFTHAARAVPCVKVTKITPIHSEKCLAWHRAVAEGSQEPLVDAPQVGMMIGDWNDYVDMIRHHSEHINPDCELKVIRDGRICRVYCPEQGVGCKYSFTAQFVVDGLNEGEVEVKKAVAKHSSGCWNHFQRTLKNLPPLPSDSSPTRSVGSSRRRSSVMPVHADLAAEDDKAPKPNTTFDSPEDMKKAVQEHTTRTNPGSGLTVQQSSTHYSLTCKLAYTGCRYEFYAAYLPEDEEGRKRLLLTDVTPVHHEQCITDLVLSGRRPPPEDLGRRTRRQTRASMSTAPAGSPLRKQIRRPSPRIPAKRARGRVAREDDSGTTESGDTSYEEDGAATARSVKRRTRRKSTSSESGVSSPAEEASESPPEEEPGEASEESNDSLAQELFPEEIPAKSEPSGEEAEQGPSQEAAQQEPSPEAAAQRPSSTPELPVPPTTRQSRLLSGLLTRKASAYLARLGYTSIRDLSAIGITNSEWSDLQEWLQDRTAVKQEEEEEEKAADVADPIQQFLVERRLALAFQREREDRHHAQHGISEGSEEDYLDP